MEVIDSNNDPKRSPKYPAPRDLTFPIEKPLFENCARGRKTLVEIGVFEGASASYFRRAMPPGATLHLIDPFISDSMNPALIARKEYAFMNINSIHNGVVRWHEDYSHHVVTTWSEPIDMLFIDGDHREESCRRDWVDWSPFVKIEGVVLFHDARKGLGDGTSWDGWEGPTKVVNELFRSSRPHPDWRIVDEAGTVVVVERIR